MLVSEKHKGHKVFDLAPDLDNYLKSIYQRSEQLHCEQTVDTSVISTTKYASLEALMELEQNNPVFFSKKTGVKRFCASLRGDVAGTSFPFSIYPQKYKPFSEFIESLPSRYKSMIVAKRDGEETRYTDMLDEIESLAKLYCQEIFGAYREDKCFGEKDINVMNVFKVMNLIICEGIPCEDTKAAITIDLVLIEGK